MTPSEVRALLDAPRGPAVEGAGPELPRRREHRTPHRAARRAATGERVVEVGPGCRVADGVARRRGRARVRGRDRSSSPPILEEVVAGLDVEVVHDDALKRRLERPARVGTLGDGCEPAVQRARPVVINVLEQAPMIRRMLVMVQREVGDRLAAGAGDEAYGAVSVKVAYYADAKVVGTVSPNVFEPRPNVESALVRLVRHATPPVAVDADRMFDLVRAGFATRRKTLRNTLAGRIDAEQFARAGVDPQARAETLALADWARLADA